MSLPIKIVEDSNLSPEKNIIKYQSNSIYQNQNIQNSPFHQSNLFNSTFSSPTLNKYSDLSAPLDSSLFHNENISQIKEFNKDNNSSEYETFIKLNENNFTKNNKTSNNSLNGKEKIEKNNLDDSDTTTCLQFLDFQQKNKILNKINIENINNKLIDLNQITNNNKESYNFNICPNIKENQKILEIKEYLKQLKEYSDKMIQTLEIICTKNENFLNSSKMIKLNESQENNLKKEKNKENIINSNEINQKNIKLNENDSSSLKSNLNLNQKEQKKIDIKQFLNINKINYIEKQKNQETKDNNMHINKIKPLKKINNRKFNIKTRGLRYNILTEEMKKQLLSDAMNMRTVEVAKKYGISTRNVNRWKKKGIERKKGSGRKFKDPRLERKILEWYKMQDKETLTSRQFKEKAIELSDNKTFRASSGWLTNMKRKYNLTFKKY